MDKGTLSRDGSRLTLRFERELKHSQEMVWRAITESSEIAYWFPSEINGPRQVGARLEFVFPAKPGETPSTSSGAGETMTGEVLAYDPPHLFEFTWAGEVLRFELTPREEGTLLVFTNTFEDEGKAARDATGWHVCLDSLGARLAGQEPEPFSAERFDNLFEEYARDFGPAASSMRRPDETA